MTEEITIDASEPIRMRVADMRIIAEITGRSWDDIFNSEDLPDRMQVLVFWKLRRIHREKGAAVLWKEAEDAEFTLEGGPATPDPTKRGSSRALPRSADTGA